MPEIKRIFFSSLGMIFLILNLIAMGYIFNLLIPKIVPGIQGIVVYLVLILIALLVAIFGATIYAANSRQKKGPIIILSIGIVAVIINLLAVILILYSLLVGL